MIEIMWGVIMVFIWSYLLWLLFASPYDEEDE